jgi:Double zinc ribbon
MFDNCPICHATVRREQLSCEICGAELHSEPASPAATVGAQKSGEDSGSGSGARTAAFCTHCGQGLTAGDLFCESCGGPIALPSVGAIAFDAPATAGLRPEAGEAASPSRLSQVQRSLPQSESSNGRVSTASPLDGYLLVAAAALVVVGSFSPWIKATAVLVGTVTRSGMDGGDGWIAILLAVPLAICGIRKLTTNHVPIPGGVTLLFSVILGGLTTYEISDSSRRAHNANQALQGAGHAAVGAGLWMLAISTALGVLGSIIALSAATSE